MSKPYAKRCAGIAVLTIAVAISLHAAARPADESQPPTPARPVPPASGTYGHCHCLFSDFNKDYIAWRVAREKDPSAKPTVQHNTCIDYEASGGAGTGSESGAGSGSSGSGSGSGSSGSNTGSAPKAKASVIPTIDFSVPDAPAFTYLGVTPTQVTQPGNTTELAAAAATIIGTDGKVRQGVAVEWQPVRTLFPPTLSSYQDRSLYALYNLKLSVATSQAAGAGSGSGSGNGSASTEINGAIGFKTTLYNAGDQIANGTYLAELDKRAKAELSLRSQYNHDDFANQFCTPQPIETIVGDAKKSLAIDGASDPTLPGSAMEYENAAAALKKFVAPAWNASSVAIAGALGTFTNTGKASDLSYRGLALWITGALQLGTYAQLIATARYHSDAHADTPGDTTLLGARLVVGTNSIAGFGEFGWNWLSPAAGSSVMTDNWGQSLVGMQLKVSDKTWLDISFGGVLDKTNEATGFFALTNLKWSMDSTPIVSAKH